MRDLFGDVSTRSIKLGSQKWYTLPLSIATHVIVCAALIVVPFTTSELLPLPPLDGGAILEDFLPRHLAYQLQEWSRTPMFQLLGLLLAWRIFPAIASPLFGLVLKILHPDVSYS